MAPLRTLAPPAHTSILTWGLARDTDLRRIRDDLLRFFTPAESDDAQPETGDAQPETGDPAELRTLAQTIGLVATELGGNALRHGLPPVIVQLLRGDGCYVLDVCDAAPDRPPVPAADRRDVRAGGRGLLIALSMAEQVCWYATEHAKHVWATFPAPRTAG